jgi:hypothetical protein
MLKFASNTNNIHYIYNRLLLQNLLKFNNYLYLDNISNKIKKAQIALLRTL